MNLSLVNEVIESCIKAEIVPELSFIIGFPEEEIEDIEKTINFAISSKILTKNPISIFLLSPYPGSEVTKKNINTIFLENKTVEELKERFSPEEILYIKRNKILFSGYYSFKKYKTSLSREKTKELYDFVMIVIERYTYFFNLLCNVLKLSFLELFQYFYEDFKILSIESILNYDGFIKRFKIEKLIEEKNINLSHEDAIVFEYDYDEKIHNAFIESNQSDEIIFDTALRYFDEDQDGITNNLQYYIIVGFQGNLLIANVKKDIYENLVTSYFELKSIKFKVYLEEILGVEF